MKWKHKSIKKIFYSHSSIKSYQLLLCSCVWFGFETRIKNIIHVRFGNLLRSFWLCTHVDTRGFWNRVASTLFRSFGVHTATTVYWFFKVIYRHYSNLFTINRCQQPAFYTGLQFWKWYIYYQHYWFYNFSTFKNSF